jgi:predicted metal-dependent peptidase
MTEPEIDLKAVEKEISRAKLKLMLGTKTTFFSALLSNLHIIITTDVPTAATNGIYMKMNPYFVLKLNKDTLLGLILHEVMHVVYDHMSVIFQGLNDNILNIAQDHYINLYLKAEGYSLPENGYCDPKFTGMSSMQIYHELMKDPPDTDDYTMDVCGPDPDMDKSEYEEAVVSNVVKAVMQAQMAKDPGSIPGDLLIRLEDVINPKLPWQVILANYINGDSKDDYSFSRPNRRFMPDFYMPTLYSESLKKITSGCDVSLSMEPEDVSAIHAENMYIWDTFQPDSMRLMTFDTEVHLNEVFTEGDQLKEIVLMGGGGTNVQPLLDSIREEEPEFALIFTDGYFGTPDMEGITTDVYWIIKGNPGFKAPHGIVIPFD